MISPDPTDLPLFGRQILGRNRSEQWTEAVATALLGDWAAPLYDGTGLGMAELGRLREEARTIHRRLVPLWQRRTYGNRRVTLLETPVYEDVTLRDLPANRHLPDDPLLDQVPGGPALPPS
ncbi:hypothetical protein [Kitasatospora sp. KL5]|uniref:hypothetical protein n=1 Tax=Kitasatospora sp. KL5 TaxID=3425125 RepID=UPI003D7006C9